MEQMINLRDLLVHEIQDLYSAEEQIIEALPSMIEKANNNQLKKALQDHLKVTEKQKDRLDEVKKLLGSEDGENGEGKGFFSKLFGGGSQKCKGTEGLIKEGEKMMGENMTTEVRDAAIIASAQKIEHYEICGYGTARAFARELNLGDVAGLLEQTLNEEYEADDLLTALAVGRLNEEAEKGRGNGRSNRSGGNGSARSSANGKSSSSRSASKGSSGSASKSASKGAASKSSASKNSSSRGASKTASKSSSGNTGGRKAGKSSSGARGGSKGASSSRGKSSPGRARSKSR